MTAPSADSRLWEDLVVETHRRGTTLVVSVRGDVDVATAPLLSAVLESLHTSRPRRVEVDLAAVTFLDSQGLAALVSARGKLAARDIPLTLVTPSRAANHALVASGLDRAFPRAGGRARREPAVSRADVREAGPAVPVRIAVAGGLWLVAAPFVLDYSTTGTAFRAYWNDIAVGLAVVALLTPRVAVPVRTASALTAATLVLGGWLALAPFLLGFADALLRATVNDVVVGAALMLLAAVTLARGIDTGPTG